MGLSKAIMVNKRVKIVEGPLKGMEGNIKKVDKRKGRIKVAIPLMKREVLVNLSFEMIE